MKSSVEQINPVQYRISVEVTGDEVDQAFSQVLRRIQKKAHLQGFRPGRAPMEMIKKFYGAQASQEVRENLIRSHLHDALTGSTLRTVAAPVIDRVDALSLGQNFTFSAVVDTMPEIKVSGYKGMEVSVTELEYSDEMLQRELHNLRQRGGKAAPLPEDKSKAEAGMMATIGHQVSKNGEALANFDVKEYAVLLGHGQLLPGLEELIIGLGVGEAKSGKVTIPADFNDPDLAGQILDINVELKDLKNFNLPTLDDDLAKDNGFESLDDLTTKIKSQLESFITQTNLKARESALVAKLVSLTSLEAPPAIVDSFIDSMINEDFQRDPKVQTHLKNENLRKQYRSKARDQVIKILLLIHIFNEEKLEVTDAEVTSEADKTISQYSLTPNERKNLPSLRLKVQQSVKEGLMIAKALKWLEEHAQITKTVKKS